MIEYVKEYLKANDVEYKENKKIKEFSPISIGGEAEIIVLPKNKFEFIDIIAFLENIGCRNKIVGNMSNILPCDERYTGVIVKTDNLSQVTVKGNRIRALSGVKLPYLSFIAARAALSGMEGISGIPGQLGGSIRGNAGAFGREISDLIFDCEVYSKKTGEIFSMTPSELAFGYRDSLLSKENLVLLSAELEFFPSEEKRIFLEMEKVREKRKVTQPVGEPSLGSVFKRTKDGISAAKLIDECGMRGFSIGGAKISEKHAGFIVNSSGATSKDVKALIEAASEAVEANFSVKLQREIEYLD